MKYGDQITQVMIVNDEEPWVEIGFGPNTEALEKLLKVLAALDVIDYKINMAHMP